VILSRCLAAFTKATAEIAERAERFHERTLSAVSAFSAVKPATCVTLSRCLTKATAEIAEIAERFHPGTISAVSAFSAG